MLVGEGGGHKHKREAIWTIAWLPHFLSSWGQVGLDLRTPQNSWYLACPFTKLKGFMFWSRPERHRRSLLSMVFNNFPLPHLPHPLAEHHLSSCPSTHTHTRTHTHTQILGSSAFLHRKHAYSFLAQTPRYITREVKAGPHVKAEAIQVTYQRLYATT